MRIFLNNSKILNSISFLGEHTMILREKYLSEIRGFYNSDLIKIITGVRRCGKSIILTQIMDEIRSFSENIIYLDFDDRSVTRFITKWEDICDYVNAHRSKEKAYIFLDEVQEIDGWASACRSLRRENCSVFISGSNSKLLSREFTKELSGRYVAFRIRPFIFQELQDYGKELGKEITILDYLKWGGFPKRIEFNTEEDQRRYLNDLDSTIVLNDIINRYHIRKTKEFQKVVDYILISNARSYSAKGIADFMRSNSVTVSANTVQKWISYMEEAYVIDELPKYSRKAKQKLAQSKKIYDCDVGLNSLRVTNGRYDLTHNLENIVFNELIYMGYTVFVYDNAGREIDFLAEKDNKRYFIQVAYSVVENKAYDREFSAFKGLSQNDRKILITMDENDYSTSTVEHIPFKKFLMMKNLQQ